MLDFQAIFWAVVIGLSFVGIFISLDVIRTKCKFLQASSTPLLLIITCSLFFFLSTLLTFLQVPTLKLFSVIYYLLSVTGLIVFIYRGRDLIRQPIMKTIKNHSFALCVMATFIFLATNWSYILKPVLAFPSIGDGLFHLTYVTKIFETGYSDLTRVPISFGNAFGEAYFSFYPSFMHYFIALLASPFVNLAMVDLAQFCKATMLFVLAGGLVFTYGIAIRIINPRSAVLIWFFIPCFAPGFRFPLEALHEGGISRIVAMYLSIGVFYSLYRSTLRPTWIAILWILLIPVGFLAHPQAFFFIGLTLAFFTILCSRKLSQLSVMSGGLVVGLLILYIFLQQMGVTSDATDEFRAHLGSTSGFSLYGQVWKAFAGKRYYVTGHIIFVVAIIGLLNLPSIGPRRGVPKLAITFFIYYVVSISILIIFSMGQVAPAKVISRLFYANPTRWAELFYFPSIFGAVFFLSCFLEMFSEKSSLIGGKVSTNISNKWYILIALVFVYHMSLEGNRLMIPHLEYWNKVNRTPSIDEYQPVTDWLKPRVTTRTLIVHPSRRLEAMGGVLGVDTTFRYGECPQSSEEVCERRSVFFAAFFKKLDGFLKKPDPQVPCLSELNQFKDYQNFYIVSRAIKIRTGLEGSRICKDAVFVGKFGSYFIIEKAK